MRGAVLCGALQKISTAWRNGWLAKTQINRARTPKAVAALHSRRISNRTHSERNVVYRLVSHCSPLTPDKRTNYPASELNELSFHITIFACRSREALPYARVHVVGTGSELAVQFKSHSSIQYGSPRVIPGDSKLSDQIGISSISTTQDENLQNLITTATELAMHAWDMHHKNGWCINRIEYLQPRSPLRTHARTSNTGSSQRQGLGT